jgi:alanine-glyoxylate transaminase/serine-glyoxylate transaminase/serine-pyruvate transaminase
MDEVQASLRWLFHTRNRFTIAVSGTGSAAMETAIVNLVEPGDSVIVGINGVFGTRLASMVERCGGKAIRLEVPWGQWIDPGQFEHSLKHSGPVKAVALVHAETSTGVHQPLAEIGILCRHHNALFIVDTVTSLGGIPVDVDGWNIDACYSATQKCLSCPPGLAPLTLSDRAMANIQKRRHPCQSWYLDCSLVDDYWNVSKRTYHHTAPVSLVYALRESLRLIQEEGLEQRIVRHRLHSDALIAGLQTLGFQLLPSRGHHLPPLTCVQLPPHVDELGIRKKLLHEFDIEIGGGLGPLAGKVWRIGLMGESSRFEHVLRLLSALEQLLAQAKNTITPGESLKAAAEILATASPPQ